MEIQIGQLHVNSAAYGLMHAKGHARDGEQSYGGSLCSRTVGCEEGREEQLVVFLARKRETE